MHEITVFQRGFQLNHSISVTSFKPGSGGIRGKISGWSRSSRARLRKALLQYTGQGQLYGITATLPYLVNMVEWRKIVERYRRNLSLLGAAGIYRVELQRNARPHLHLVIWSTVSPASLWDAWIRALSVTVVVDDKYGRICLDQVDGALLHSCLITDIGSGAFSAYRYLCDHASKHKQAQLGYQGRQWGFINRSCLYSSYCCSFDLTDYQYDWVLRLIRRLSHCRVSRGNGGRSVWFTRPETLAKIIDFVQDSLS